MYEYCTIYWAINFYLLTYLLTYTHTHTHTPENITFHTLQYIPFLPEWIYIYMCVCVCVCVIHHLGLLLVTQPAFPYGGSSELM